MDIDWGDVLRGGLAFFFIIVGVGIAWVCVRLGGLFGRVSVSVNRVTDEVVPILSKAQTTMDGINTEIGRVDEIMQTAVTTTKGDKKAVGTVSRAVTAPVKKISGLGAGVQEAVATFKARRAAERAAREEAESAFRPPAPEPAAVPADPAPAATETITETVTETVTETTVEVVDFTAEVISAAADGAAPRAPDAGADIFRSARAAERGDG